MTKTLRNRLTLLGTTSLFAVAMAVAFPGGSAEAQPSQAEAAELVLGDDELAGSSGFAGVTEIKGIGKVVPSTNRWGVSVEGLTASTTHNVHNSDGDKCSGPIVGQVTTDSLGFGLNTFDNSNDVKDDVDVCEGSDHRLTGTLGPVRGVARP